SESKEAIDKMLELNVTDQRFLMHILEDLMRQNGFVEPNSANGTTYNRNTANSLSHLDHNNNNNNNNNTPIMNTGNKTESLTMTMAMQISSEDTLTKDPQWQSFAQLSTRKYDKSQRLSMQSPFGTRSKKKSDLLLFQRHQQQLIFDFDSSNANKSPFTAAFSTRQHETTPYHQRWNTQHLGASGTKQRESPTAYQLLQTDFEKLDSNFKQLSTQYFQLKQDHQLLQEKVQTNASDDFQKNEREYQTKLAMLEERERRLQETDQAHLKEAKRYEELTRKLQADNERLNEELAQLMTLHDAQVRQCQSGDASAADVEMKDLGTVKDNNNDLFLKEISDLKLQLSQIPQLKEQVETYKQQIVEYKARLADSCANDTNRVSDAIDAKDRVAYLEVELSNATQEREDMALKLRECRNDMSALRLQVIELRNYQRDFNRYKKDIDDNKNEQLKQAMEELEAQRHAANDAQGRYREAAREVSELKEQMKKLEWTVQGHKESLSSSPSLQSKTEWVKKVAEVNELQLQVAQKVQDIEQLQKQIEELTQANRLLQEQNRDKSVQCQEMQKQIDAIIQYSSEQKKKLKEYHTALEQLHHQKTYVGNNDCQTHKDTIEALKSEIRQVLQKKKKKKTRYFFLHFEEKQLHFESHRRELLGISNAFHHLALQKTLEGQKPTWFAQQSNTNFEMTNDVVNKGKENSNDFNQSHKIMSAQ
ncbi:hypothetical protein RFI_19837, partial [Reticulomyxa filosa]